MIISRSASAIGPASVNLGHPSMRVSMAVPNHGPYQPHPPPPEFVDQVEHVIIRKTDYHHEVFVRDL